jgi:competence protein ComEC
MQIFTFFTSDQIILCARRKNLTGDYANASFCAKIVPRGGEKMAFYRRCCAVLMLCLLSSFVGCTRQKPVGLCVEILDVGQGDCTLITADDSVLMIDTGTAAARHDVQGHLSERRIERIDYLLLTHPHEDHVGNARMLIETDTVGALIVPQTEEDTQAWQLIMHVAAEKGIPVYTAREGDVYTVGGAELEILQVLYEAEDVNDQSVICRVTYGEIVCLFTADAEEKSEACLLDRVPPERLNCDLLKAGHHGAASATSAAFLAATSPDFVAISCGRGNPYNHPVQRVLDAIADAGAIACRTDTEGTLVFLSDGARLWRAR